MNENMSPNPEWVKSSLSFANGNCLEVSGLDTEEIAVRNSRHPDGPVLRFTPAEWDAFLGGVRLGEFDRFGGGGCPIEAVLPDGHHPCTLGHSHAGDHDFADEGGYADEGSGQ